MKKILGYVLFCILIPAIGFCQSNKYENYDTLITTVKGDLNKDGLIDVVTVTQDTLNKYGTYRLEIYFAKPKGYTDLMFCTERIIEPQYPEGKDGYRTGNGFDSLEITNGVLRIKNQLLRGHYEHKFRFQESKFELIGYTYVNSDGLGKIYSIDYNLSTGKLVELIESYEEEEVFKNSTRIVKPKKLPNLLDFEPFSGDYY